MQIEADLEEELWAWGRWARACPSRSLNYPYQTPFNKFRGTAISACSLITEERAMELDQAIAHIYHKDGDTISLIIGYFQYGLSTREIQDITGENKDKIARNVECAVKWITGYFVGKRMAA